ncbi:MAG: hypothetical protein WA964_05520 [Ilumatobacter sp.]|uniref:hypothetical protein n=1 Tax=Ilumatobacter sp. TaxID=1967498 RepID=UPI003C76868D
MDDVLTDGEWIVEAESFGRTRWRCHAAVDAAGSLCGIRSHPQERRRRERCENDESDPTRL